MEYSNDNIVPLNEFHAFVVRVMVAVGISHVDACALADLLMSADYRGHFTHGLNRLGRSSCSVLPGVLFALIHVRSCNKRHCRKGTNPVLKFRCLSLLCGTCGTITINQRTIEVQ